MKNTTRKQTPNRKNYNGFAIPLAADTQLGLSILIAEDEEGHTQPIACANTIAEASELAFSDFRSRMRRLAANEDAGLCPYVYKLWARGIEGEYIVAWSIEASQL